MIRLFLGVVLLATTLTTYTQPTSIQTKTNSASSASTVSITLTQAPTAPDVLLCSASHTSGSGATFTFPAGFTATSSGQQNVGTSLAVERAYHVVANGDPSTYTVTTSTSVTTLNLGCTEYEYVNTTTPIMADSCSANAAPTATVSGPQVQALKPTVADSLFAATGTALTDTPQAGVTNYDTSSGSLFIRDQHSTPIYNFQQLFGDSLVYNSAPTRSITCTTLLNVVTTPFTLPLGAATAVPVSTPTPAPTSTPTPPPFGSAPTHVMTAEYLGTLSTADAILKNTNPSVYAPYLTIAYAMNNRIKLTQNAGIKTIAYTSPTQIWCSNGASPTMSSCTGDGGEFNIFKGGYTNTQARDCSGNLVYGYGGKAYVTNVLPTYTAGGNTVANAGPYYQAFYNSANSSLVSQNPGLVSPDYWFVDNANDYGISPNPCGSTRAIWAQGLATSFGGLTMPGTSKVILNSIGFWTMTDEQAVMNSLNSSNVAGAEYEGCYGQMYNGAPTVWGTNVKWYETQYAEINVIRKSKFFWCYNEVTTDGSTQVPNRIYMYASFLLTYNPQYAIFETAMATSPSRFKVYPETQFVPMNPTVTANDVSGYKCGNVYCRNFGNCYFNGTNKGACEVVVNPDPTSTFAIPSNTFTHTLVLVGAGVLDGGSAAFNGPIVTSLGPLKAAILMP